MVAESFLVSVRPLLILLAWVLSRQSNQSPRHKKRAVATTPSPAKKSSAVPSLCSGQALSTVKGQAPSEGKANEGWEQGV